jgi:hypothetical protein
MAGQQARAAGIPDPLFGPEFPGSQRSGADEGRAAYKKFTSFQAGQFLM